MWRRSGYPGAHMANAALPRRHRPCRRRSLWPHTDACAGGAAAPPEALTDVLYRLADPAVPGNQKLSLVESATPDNVAALDKFPTALIDGGYAPVTFNATDIAWSDKHPADVVATVNVSSPKRDAAGFSFPMEFKPYQGGWQLSQQTADMLLGLGNSPPGTSPTPTP
ncbi:putative lipoprotein lppK [Mycobacterium xenopi 3993]|nr:putative lipoprotein lppK [Mycobacterium xenopi 3993]